MKLKNYVKRAAALLMAGCMLLQVTGCGSSSDSTATETADASSDGSTLNVLYHLLPNGTLDPATDYNYYLVRSGVAETLFKVGDDLTTEPWIAESGESNDDSTVWTIQIKEGVVFSNGNTCDAEAVKANIERLIEAENSTATGLDIKSMEADGLTLTITTNTPKVAMLSELAHPQMCILDVDAGGFDESPVATGPYKIDNYELNVGLHLSRNDNYWDGEVPYDTVNFLYNNDASSRLMSLQSGDADLITNPSTDSLTAIADAEDTDYAMADYGVRAHYVSYNCTRPYVSDSNFRKGIDSLIDKEEIVDTIYNGAGSVAHGGLPDGTAFTPDYEIHDYDVDKALEYFEAAGLTVEDGQVTDNGETIHLIFNTYSSQPEFPVIAQLLQASLASVGIEVEITQCSVDINSYLGDEANIDAWDMSMTTMFVMPRGDGAHVCNVSLSSSSIYNYIGVEDATMQGYIDAANTEGDADTRTELIKSAVQYETEQCYISWIINTKNLVAYRTDKINPVTSAEFYIVTKDVTPVE